LSEFPELIKMTQSSSTKPRYVLRLHNLKN